MAMSSERHVKTIEEPLNVAQLEEAGENVLERFRQDIREVGLDMELFENRLRNLMRTSLPRTIPTRWEEGITPPIDIEETPTAYLVKTSLPGVPKDKIEIRFWGQTLDVKAEVEPPVKEAVTKSYLYRERTEASYHRRMRFPAPILPDKTEALLENGILTVSVPKLEPAKELRIRVR